MNVSYTTRFSRRRQGASGSFKFSVQLTLLMNAKSNRAKAFDSILYSSIGTRRKKVIKNESMIRSRRGKPNQQIQQRALQKNDEPAARHQTIPSVLIELPGECQYGHRRLV